MDAATLEFAEVGLKDASLDSIAGRAGMEPGVVRALFIDKENLLRELLKEATDPMVSGIAMAVQEVKDHREVIRKSLHMYDQWLLDHPELVTIMVRCVVNEPATLNRIYQSSLLPSEFFEHLQQLIDRGELRCNNPFVLHTLFDSLILFPHMLRSTMELMNPEMPVEEVIRTRFDTMIDLFENGLYGDNK